MMVNFPPGRSVWYQKWFRFWVLAGCSTYREFLQNPYCYSGRSNYIEYIFLNFFLIKLKSQVREHYFVICWKWWSRRSVKTLLEYRVEFVSVCSVAKPVEIIIFSALNLKLSFKMKMFRLTCIDCILKKREVGFVVRLKTSRVLSLIQQSTLNWQTIDWL